MKRVILGALAVAAVGLTFDIPAQAQVSSGKNPWCMRDGTFGPGSWDCSYHNLRQCLESANGLGGTCQPNPNYRGKQNNRRS